MGEPPRIVTAGNIWLTTDKDDDSIEIRSMKQCEASGVVRLIYECYGDTYFYEKFYLPERIADFNERGAMKSLVAVNKSGEIIGHITVFKNESIGRVALAGIQTECNLGEPAMLMVRPDYRNRGIPAAMMRRILEEDASYTENLFGLFCPPLAEHVYSQLVMYKFGFKDCGCFLGIYPPAEIKEISTKNLQRISLILTYYSLKNQTSNIIFPPRQHSKAILDIYDHLGRACHCGEIPYNYDASSSETSLIQTITTPEHNNASIKVLHYGADIVKRVKEELTQMLATNTQAVLLYLSLNDPLTCRYTEQFEQLGFFFAGVLPAMSIGDALILQYLHVSDFDYSKIHITSKKAEKILNYVRECESTAMQPN